MKNLLKIAILGFATMLVTSCSNNPQTGNYANQQYQSDYQQQEPILVRDGSSSFLMDYMLYQSLMNSHQNPAYYYRSHRNDVHIHVNNGHGFSGYRGHYSTIYRPVTRVYPSTRTRVYNTSPSTRYYNTSRSSMNTSRSSNYSRPSYSRPSTSYSRPTSSYKPSMGSYTKSYSRPSSSSSSRSYSRH